MKHPNFIACVLVAAGAFVWVGCSSSTNTALTVTPTGALVAPASVNFGNTRLGVCADTLLGVPRDTNVSIQNTGTDTLRIYSVTPQSSLFSVAWFDTAIAPGANGTMQLDFCPAQTGVASATLLIKSNAAQDSSLTITLTGNGVPYSPGVGSQYTYSVFKLDTAGKTLGSLPSVTDSIIATGITYQDSSNVSESSDSTYYIFESNGDVCLYASGFPTYPVTNLVGGGWQTLPFGSQVQNVYSYPDTYTDSAGEMVTLSIHDTAKYMGTTNIKINGVSYPVSHVQLREYGLYSDTKGTNSDVVTAEIYFSPELGTIVDRSRYTKDVATAASGKPRVVTGGGTEITLTSFQAH